MPKSIKETQFFSYEKEGLPYVMSESIYNTDQIDQQTSPLHEFVRRNHVLHYGKNNKNNKNPFLLGNILKNK